MANTKTSDLTALTSPSDDDILYIVDTPGTTPTGKKITFGNFRTNLVSLTGTETLTNKTLTSPVLNTFTGTGGTITVADEGNTVGLTITQNDITNNPNALNITTASNKKGIYILRSVAAASSADGVITAGSTAVDGGAVIYANHANASATGNVETIVNAGTGNGLLIDQNSAGLALFIDKDITNVSNTSSPNNRSAHIDDTLTVTNGNTYAKSGEVLYVMSRVVETSGSVTDSKVVIKADQLHADATGKVIYVSNAGTGNGLFIDQNGNGVSLNIDSEATSANLIAADSQNSSGNLLQLSVNTVNKFTVDYTGAVTATSIKANKRVVTTTDDATSVINCTTTDVYELSAVANATEFSITGTPVDGQTILIRFKDAGVAKDLTWTGITAIGVILPTTTTAGKWHYVGITYNLAATAWHAIAVIEQT